MGIVATIAAQALNFYEWLVPRLKAMALENLWTRLWDPTFGGGDFLPAQHVLNVAAGVSQLTP
jgi:hypothetical protein